jgi:hydroxyethylthiazole kinase-like sugar kinase family protein
VGVNEGTGVGAKVGVGSGVAVGSLVGVAILVAGDSNTGTVESVGVAVAFTKISGPQAVRASEASATRSGNYLMGPRRFLFDRSRRGYGFFDKNANAFFQLTA